MSDQTLLSAAEAAGYEITVLKRALALVYRRAHRSGLGWVKIHDAYQAGVARAKKEPMP